MTYQKGVYSLSAVMNIVVVGIVGGVGVVGVVGDLLSHLLLHIQREGVFTFVLYYSEGRNGTRGWVTS